MTKQNPCVPLFDAYKLDVPVGLTVSLDGSKGQRILTLTDKKSSFTVSFEEGMALMDMQFSGQTPCCPVITLQCCRGDKYIQLRRAVGEGKTVALFHIEVDDENGCTLKIPGKMTTRPDYPWSDTIEPVLLQIMDGLTIVKEEP